MLVTGCVTADGGNGPGPVTSEQHVCEYNSTLYVAGGALLGFGMAKLLGVNNKGGLAISTVVGGLLGHNVQDYLAHRCQQLAEAKKRMKSSQIETSQVAVNTWNNPDKKAIKDTGLVVTVSSKSMFPVGKATLSPGAEADMRVLARTFKGTTRKVLIVGHTDSTGSAELNQAISEQRAKSVAKIFYEGGVPLSALYFKGAGEAQPIADNSTAEGRAKNRRVDVVELSSASGMLSYENSLDSSPRILAKEVPQKNPQVKSSSSPSALAVALKPGTAIDFGGREVDGSGAVLADAVGAEQPESSLMASISLIGKAFAKGKPDPLLNTACIADKYKRLAPVKSFATGKDVTDQFSARDFMPGFDHDSWGDKVNGNLVAMANVSLLRDGGRSVGQPEMYVFKNYKSGDAQPTLKGSPNVRTYVGEIGVLYRAFYGPGAWPVRCMDVVFDRKNPGKSSAGTLYYDKDGKVFAADFRPGRVMKNTKGSTN